MTIIACPLCGAPGTPDLCAECTTFVVTADRIRAAAQARRAMDAFDTFTEEQARGARRGEAQKCIGDAVTALGDVLRAMDRHTVTAEHAGRVLADLAGSLGATEMPRETPEASAPRPTRPRPHHDRHGLRLVTEGA